MEIFFRGSLCRREYGMVGKIMRLGCCFLMAVGMVWTHAAPSLAAAPSDGSGKTSVQASVAGALRHHRSLMSAKESRTAAEHSLRQARAGFGPRVDVSGRSGMGIISDSSSRAYNLDKEWLGVGSVSAQLVQPLWDGFATRSRTRMAQAALDSAQARLLDTETTVTLNAVVAHLNLLRCRVLRELAQENVARHESIVQQAYERLALGADTQADVAQAQSRLKRAESLLSEADAALQTAYATYTRTTGMEPRNLEEVSPPPGMPSDVETLLQIAEKQNPTLAMYLQEIRAAKGEKELNESTFLPSVQLEAGPSYSDRGGNRERWVYSFDVTVGVQWNIFSSGADVEGLRSASAKERAARQNFYDFMDSLRLDMRSAWDSYQAAKEEYAHYKEAIIYNQRTCDAYHQQFLLGTRSLLDVLDSESELYTSRSQAETARATAIAGAYNLVALAGDLLTRLKVSPEILSAEPLPAPPVKGEDFELGWFK